MRVAPRTSNWINWIGSAALVFAVALASPGVRVSHAEAGTAGQNFSWDPALEPVAAAEPTPAARFGRSIAVTPPAGTCAAQNATVLPTTRALRQGLEGMPLLIADGADGELNSLNGRGYNIGKTEPSADLQRLMIEAGRLSR